MKRSIFTEPPSTRSRAYRPVVNVSLRGNRIIDVYPPHEAQYPTPAMLGTIPAVQLCLNAGTIGAAPRGERPVEELIPATAAAGFKLIGFSMATIEEYITRGGTLSTLRALLDGAGLHCVELSNVRPGPTLDEDAQRACTMAVALDVPVVYGMAPEPGTMDPDEVYRQFGRAADVMANAGKTFAIEFTPYTTVNSIATGHTAIQRIGRPNVKLLVDTWHVFRGTTTWAELDSIPIDEISHLQFCDAGPRSLHDQLDSMNARRLPGDGEFDLHRFIDVLHRRGFDGVVSVEVLSIALRSMDPTEAARQAYATSLPYLPT